MYTDYDDDFIISSWEGRIKLWKVFWIYQILCGLLIVFLLFLFALLLSFLKVPNIIVLIICNILFAPFLIWIFVSLWRCAFNVNHKFWGFLVRFIVILEILDLLQNIIVKRQVPFAISISI